MASVVVTSDGAVGVLPDGAEAVANEAGVCQECCGGAPPGQNVCCVALEDGQQLCGATVEPDTPSPGFTGTAFGLRLVGSIRAQGSMTIDGLVAATCNHTATLNLGGAVRIVVAGPAARSWGNIGAYVIGGNEQVSRFFAVPWTPQTNWRVPTPFQATTGVVTACELADGNQPVRSTRYIAAGPFGVESQYFMTFPPAPGQRVLQQAGSADFRSDRPLGFGVHAFNGTTASVAFDAPQAFRDLYGTNIVEARIGGFEAGYLRAIGRLGQPFAHYVLGPPDGVLYTGGAPNPNNWPDPGGLALYSYSVGQPQITTRVAGCAAEVRVVHAISETVYTRCTLGGSRAGERTLGVGTCSYTIDLSARLSLGACVVGREGLGGGERSAVELLQGLLSGRGA